jgi:hypothetical protein
MPATIYEFRRATEPELKLFYETAVLPKMEFVHICMMDGKPVAVAGIIPDPDYTGSWMDDGAKPMAFMDIGKDFPKHLGFDAVRRLRDVLKKYRSDVFVQHDHQFPSAVKLLHALGFRPTGVWRRDMQNTGRHLQIWRRPAAAITGE